MAASSIPAAKAALLAAIRAQALTTNSPIANAYVDWSGPADPSQAPQVDRVFLTDTVAITREWGPGIGQQRIVENYTLQIVVETVVAGNDPQATEVRLWSLVNEVEQAVRADVKLGGTVPRGALVGDIPAQQMGPADDDHWLARATLHVVCEAVI
jgi:hypothetical protein